MANRDHSHGQRLQKYDPDTDGGARQVNQAKANSMNILSLMLLLVLCGVVGYIAFIVLKGVIAIVGAVLLVLIGIGAMALSINSRRIVTPEELAAQATYLEVMAARAKKSVSQFNTDTSMWDTATPEQKTSVSKQLRNSFLFECLFNLSGFVIVAAHGFNGANKTMTVSLLCFFASMALLVHTLKYGILYIAWPVQSEKPAASEYFGPWLLSRIRYVVVVLYVLGFLAVKFGIF